MEEPPRPDTVRETDEVGIKPFSYSVYEKWRDRRIVRFLKPNWRGWLYRKLLAVEEELRRLREELWT